MTNQLVFYGEEGGVNIQSLGYPFYFSSIHDLPIGQNFVDVPHGWVMAISSLAIKPVDHQLYAAMLDGLNNPKAICYKCAILHGLR